jgi:hypothetical protein
MGVRHEWADDRHIIMNIYVEYPWTWAEYRQMMQTIKPLLIAEQHPCATVIECSKLRNLPKDGSFLNILLNIEKDLPDNLFASAIVAAPQVVMVFMNMLMSLRPRAKTLSVFTRTLAEAHEKIYARYSFDPPKGESQARP